MKLDINCVTGRRNELMNANPPRVFDNGTRQCTARPSNRKVHSWTTTRPNSIIDWDDTSDDDINAFHRR